MAGPGGFDALGAIAAVGRGEITADEVLADAAARAEAFEPWLGAVVTPLQRRDVDGPLSGMVAGIKDLIAVKGVPRGCGAPKVVDMTPQAADASAVVALVGAGAGLLATLETHPLAFGVVTPQTRNPRAPGRIAGGSSGGPAAALAAGLVHVALGTDTGGSVRNPAACCGVVGFKPSRGLIPLTGVLPLAWSLDTVGPLATTVADVRLAFDHLVRFDAADPVSIPEPVMRPATPAPFTVGVPRQLADLPIDPDVRAVHRDVLDRLAEAGCRIVEVDLPLLAEAPAANGKILVAEAAALYADAVRDRPEDFPASAIDRVRWGGQLLAADVAESRRLAVEFAAQLRDLRGTVDVLCTPSMACRVPDVGADEIDVDGDTQPTTFAVTKLSNPWNVIGAPAGSVPAGTDSGGGPVGVQIIGAWGDEYTVLAAMELVEQVTGGPWPTVDATDVVAD